MLLQKSLFAGVPAGPVDSATSAPGISDRTRSQIRCPVCRCFRGAFRSGGMAFSSACRSIRRCTLDFRATPLMPRITFGKATAHLYRTDVVIEPRGSKIV